jgi:enoyl-CoA hydratase/carnithine racemase
MEFVALQKANGIATLTWQKQSERSQPTVVDQLRVQLKTLEIDREVSGSVVVTGSSKFFSFGFDTQNSSR